MLDHNLYATRLYPRSNVVHNRITQNLLERMSLIYPTSEDFSKLNQDLFCLSNDNYSKSSNIGLLKTINRMPSRLSETLIGSQNRNEQNKENLTNKNTEIKNMVCS